MTLQRTERGEGASNTLTLSLLTVTLNPSENSTFSLVSNSVFLPLPSRVTLPAFKESGGALIKRTADFQQIAQGDVALAPLKRAYKGSINVCG
jgi:hypothetical protein